MTYVPPDHVARCGARKRVSVCILSSTIKKTTKSTCASTIDKKQVCSDIYSKIHANRYAHAIPFLTFIATKPIWANLEVTTLGGFENHESNECTCFSYVCVVTPRDSMQTFSGKTL